MLTVAKKILRSVILYSGYVFHHNRKSKILFYHDVGKEYTEMGTPLSMIKKHLDVIRKENFQIVNKISETNNQIMICFDDGWRGLYDSKGFFVQEKIYPTVFVAVDLIGSDGHLSMAQIKELRGLGFLFETHTWSHKDLTTYDEEGLAHELRDSKQKLEEMLNMKMEALCFPEGRFSDFVMEEAVKAGYKELYSSISGAFYDRIGEGYICRNLVQDLSSQEVKYVIRGHSNYMAKRNFKQHYQEL